MELTRWIKAFYPFVKYLRDVVGHQEVYKRNWSSQLGTTRPHGKKYIKMKSHSEGYALPSRSMTLEAIWFCT